MAEIVAAALTAHAPLITGRSDVSRPDQRDRLYELGANPYLIRRVFRRRFSV
jgi:hypothetical protein